MSKDAVPEIPPFKDESLQQSADWAIFEVKRQDRMARAGKFGGTHILPGGPNSDRLGVLVEEVGEVAEALNEIRMGRGSLNDLEDELVQTAACALAWLAAIYEGRGGV